MFEMVLLRFNASLQISHQRLFCFFQLHRCGSYLLETLFNFLSKCFYVVSDLHTLMFYCERRPAITRKQSEIGYTFIGTFLYSLVVQKPPLKYFLLILEHPVH